MRTNLPTRDPDDAPVPEGPWTGAPTPRPASRFGRRSVPHLVLGMLLVVGCAVGFLVVSAESAGRYPVLVTARPVTVGQVLTAQDLRQVDLPLAVEIRSVGADRAADVVGRPVATSLPAGALITPEALGGAGAPRGQAIVALALDAGRLPPEVSAGDRVTVVAAPDRAGPGGLVVAPRSWSAVVTSVSPSETGQLTVVSVQLAEAPARDVAATPVGGVSLVLLAAGG